jgi:hypothetical protein
MPGACLRALLQTSAPDSCLGEGKVRARDWGSRPRFNGATVLDAYQVKPTFRMKCPSLRLSTPPPAQCTMNASILGGMECFSIDISGLAAGES